MISNKLSLLGIAFKAGKVICGTAACEKGVKSNKIMLVILSGSISAGSEKHFKTLCERHSVDYIKLDEPVGKAIGKGHVLVVGITDNGFKKAVLKA